MTLDELKTEWEQDAIVGEDLGGAALRGPLLHSKYLNELSTYRMKLVKLDHEMAELKTIKSKYFRGEMTKGELEERGWAQWQYKTLKADIADLIDSDSDFHKITARHSYIKITIQFLESVIGEIKNRNFAIKAAIDWQKFRAGA